MTFAINQNRATPPLSVFSGAEDPSPGSNGSVQSVIEIAHNKPHANSRRSFVIGRPRIDFEDQAIHVAAKMLRPVTVLLRFKLAAERLVNRDQAFRIKGSQDHQIQSFQFKAPRKAAPMANGLRASANSA